MILIKNINVIPMYEDGLVLENVNIYIKDGKIFEISNKEYEAEKVIDGTGKLAIPGLINTHTHMGMSLFRNYGNDLALYDWLTQAIFPLEAKLTSDDIYYGSMLNMVEMIKSGCTRFVDMYMYEDRVAQAAQEVGMGAVIATGFVDGNDIGEASELVREAAKKYENSSLIDVAVAPHAIYTVSRNNLEKLTDLSHSLDTLMHIHVSETEKEVFDSINEYKMSPVKYLNDIGLFDRPTIAAHCVHVDDEDMKIFKEKDVTVAHNASSNLKLASGFAPVAKMNEMDINVTIGTDGSASNNNINMIEEIHLASLLAKGVSKDPKALDAYTSLKLATVNGAKAIRRVDLGKISEGYAADIAIYDLDGIHMTPVNDLISSVAYSLQGSDCSTVIIDGKIVMEDRKVLNINEEDLKREVRERADRLING